MRKSRFNIKVLLPCLLLMIVCALIQFISFRVTMKQESNNRYEDEYCAFVSDEEAMQSSE